MAELNLAQSNKAQMQTGPTSPYLKFLNGPKANQFVPLDFGALSHQPQVLGRPGREFTPDIILLDPEQKVSSHHAELSFRTADGCLVLKDLGSTNGTFVDGWRLAGVTPLLPGDIITCGKINLLFGVPGWQEAPELANLNDYERATFLEDHQPGFGRLDILETRAEGLHTNSFVRLTPQREFQIGRLSENDLALMDEITSRRHAELCWLGGNYVLTDLGAAIPTKVRFDSAGQAQEETVEVPRPLKDGDSLVVGTTVLRYRAPRLGYSKFPANQSTKSGQTVKIATVGVLRYAATHRPLEIGPRAFELPTDRQVLIGRADSNNLRLTDSSVSRRHARLGFENGQYIVTDLGAANRTQINGQEIAAPTPLRVGDHINLGDYEFVFEMEQPGQAQSTLLDSQDPLSLQLGKAGQAAADSSVEAKAEPQVKVLDHPLRKITPFDELDPVNFNRLAPLFKEATFQPGHEMAREGQNKGMFYAILEGTVTVSRTLDTGDKLVLCEIGPGAVYGERTIVANQSFGNRLEAKTSVRVLQLDEATFSRELGAIKPILAFFQQQVAVYSAINWLRGTVLMRTFSDKTLRELASRLRLRVFGPGETLTEKGQPCDEFYLILTGRAVVYTNNSRGQEQELAALETGDTFGDGIAAPNETYPVAVRAAAPTECFLLARADFEVVLQNSGDLIASLPRGLSSLPISAVLNRVNPFSSMPPQLVAQIAAKMKLKRFKKDESILMQGDEASAFYVIKSGRVDIFFETSDGQRRKDMKLGTGQYFGEASLFTNTARTDSVVAAEDCELLALYRNNLEEVLRLGESYDLAQYFARNLSKRFRPKRVENCMLTEQTNATGEHFYILSRTGGDNYYKLSDRSYFLWQLMDGDNSINDLSTAYFYQYKSFDGGIVNHLVGQLQAGGFLEMPPVDEKLMVTGARQENRWEGFGRKVEQVLNAHVEVKNIDGVAGALYNSIGRVFFWRPIAILLSVLMTVGLGAFIYFSLTDFFASSDAPNDAIPGWLVFLLLVITVIFNVLIHETAHALAVKRYKRRVPSGGFGFGFFYVDTNEIWMEGRGPRIVVNLAGPISNAIFGSICSLLLIAYSPVTTAVGGLLMTMATIGFVLVYLNFNPFIETDGYYALMDWTEIPGLRRKALVWLRTRLFHNNQALKVKPTDKRVYKVFGLITLLYLPLTLALYLFVAAQIANAVLGLFMPTNWAGAISWILTALLGLYTAYNLVRDLLTASQKTNDDDDDNLTAPKRNRRKATR